MPSLPNGSIADLEIVGPASGIGGWRITNFADISGTPGNGTANAIRGRAAVAAGQSTCAVSNTFVTARSQVICTLETNDGTLVAIKSVVPGSSTFTLTGSAAATGTTVFSWVVLN